MPPRPQYSPGFLSAYFLDAVFAPIPVGETPAEHPLKRRSKPKRASGRKPARIPPYQLPLGQPGSVEAEVTS